MSWLQPKKGGLHFILSYNDNYYFDVKVFFFFVEKVMLRLDVVDLWVFFTFVNNVIDCECLECVFCFKIKEKERQILYQLLFYNIPPKFFFFFFFSHLFN